MDSLIDWLQQWNHPGTLGDVLPWAISGAFLMVGFFARWIARRRQRARSQATKVIKWTERDDNRDVVIRIRNSSREPIQDIIATVAFPADAMTDRIEEGIQGNAFKLAVIGPEQTVTLPVNLDRMRVRELPLSTLHFCDRAGLSWLIDERNRLRKRRKRLRAGLFAPEVMTGEIGVVEHHNSGAATDSSGRLNFVPVSRMDLRDVDGTSITVTFVPKGQEASAVSFMEARAAGAKFAEAGFDDKDHLVWLKVCNLPSDTRRHLEHRHYHLANDSYIMTFSDRAGEAIDALKARIGSAQEINTGGPVGHLGEVAYDDEGHLVWLRVANASRRLIPGFFGT